MGYENPEKIPKYSTYRVQILIDFEWEVEMKKEDVLLRLIAISGELPAGLVGEIVESESYAAALITRLKKENYISVRNAGGYKGYVLRRKGKRYLLERYEDDLSFFLSGSAQTNHVKSEPEKRLRLYRMSEVWVFLWKMGIEIFQSQKPDLGNGFEKVGKKQCIMAVWNTKRAQKQSRVPEPAACYLPGIQLMSFTTPWQKE